MQTINLKKIIEAQNLDVKDVAEHLFPGNKYPKLALDRVLTRKAFLDSNQVSRLSMLTGIPIELLYSGGDWATKCSDSTITFSSGDFVAELNTDSWVTKIYHKDTIFHEGLVHGRNIALSIYLEELTNLIIKYNKNEAN
jgi:hypothetical protein